MKTLICKGTFSICGNKELPESEFYPASQNKSGRDNLCKNCRRNYHRERKRKVRNQDYVSPLLDSWDYEIREEKTPEYLANQKAFLDEWYQKESQRFEASMYRRNNIIVT